jgi:hypothetical protein
MSKNKTRIQFDFNDAQLALLDDLVDRMNASSRAEVVRRALHLLDMVERGTLMMVDVDGNVHTVRII